MFKFRLQRVLELRAEAEQAKARVLATAQEAADVARRAQERMQALHDTSRAEVRAAQDHAPRVGHLQQLGVVVQSLAARVDRAAEHVQHAEGLVAEAQGQLELAARDRRVLDRLKARHAEVWRANEAHKDRLQMDEIALSRFARIGDAARDSQTSSGDDAHASDHHGTQRTTNDSITSDQRTGERVDHDANTGATSSIDRSPQ